MYNENVDRLEQGTKNGNYRDYWKTEREKSRGDGKSQGRNYGCIHLYFYA
jgi:hypothetical protein